MHSPLKSVLLFGAPGSGKGTQGKVLGAIPGYHHCATGDIFRSIDHDSELGKIFLEYSSRGELVPDDVTVKIWQNTIAEKTARGVYKADRDMLILDGIPRTVEQARIMDELMEVLKIIHLICKDREALFERLRRRAFKENRQDDADERVIRNRWEVYERESAPVLSHYRKDLIVEVDPIGSPARVLRDILEIVQPIHEKQFPAYEG